MNTKNIILIGYMGSGKTVIGRNTARLLDYDFADTDEMISEVTGLTLSQLFRKHGEIRFRSEERLVLKKLAQRQRTVIAFGGSLPPQKEDIDLLVPGFFVMLTAAPEIIMSRLGRKNNRLLIGGRPSEEKIQQMIEERKLLFGDKICCTIDTGQLTVDEAAEAIAKAYQAWTE